MDDLTIELENLRRHMRGTNHTYEDVAIDACREIIMSKAAAMFLNEAFSARGVLRETAQPLLPPPAPPSPIQHRPQPQYGHVPPIEDRYAEEHFPRVAQNWPDHRRAS